MSRSTVSRRFSEFVGVLLFAAALIWIISLASYEPSDPVWFFSTGLHAAPANFAGRVGAFLAELSFQLFGYASYLIPAVLVVVGWNYFWCRSLDAAATKATGAVLLFGCISAFLSLVVGTLEVSGKPFRAGGSAGEFLARQLSDYLNRTGSLIVILTLIFLAIIMSTQFSFGRFFAAIVESIRGSVTRGVDALHEWREEKRRERQRREVIAKHTKKGSVPASADASAGKPAIAVAAAGKPPLGEAPAGKATFTEAPPPAARKRPAPTDEDDDDDHEAPAAKSGVFGSLKSFAPPKPPKIAT